MGVRGRRWGVGVLPLRVADAALSPPLCRELDVNFPTPKMNFDGARDLRDRYGPCTPHHGPDLRWSVGVHARVFLSFAPSQSEKIVSFDPTKTQANHSLHTGACERARALPARFGLGFGVVGRVVTRERRATSKTFEIRVRESVSASEDRAEGPATHPREILPGDPRMRRWKVALARGESSAPTLAPLHYA